MKIAWLSLPLWLVVQGCQSATTPEPAVASDEPIAISMAIGGVT